MTDAAILLKELGTMCRLRCQARNLFMSLLQSQSFHLTPSEALESRLQRMLQEGAQFRILDLLELEQHFTTNGPVRKSFSRRSNLALLHVGKPLLDPFTLFEKHSQELPALFLPHPAPEITHPWVRAPESMMLVSSWTSTCCISGHRSGLTSALKACIQSSSGRTAH